MTFYLFYFLLPHFQHFDGTPNNERGNLTSLRITVCISYDQLLLQISNFLNVSIGKTVLIPNIVVQFYTLYKPWVPCLHYSILEGIGVTLALQTVFQWSHHPN